MRAALIVSLIVNAALFVTAYFSVGWMEQRDDLIAELKKQHTADTLLCEAYAETNKKLTARLSEKDRMLDDALNMLARDQRVFDKLAEEARIDAKQ